MLVFQAQVQSRCVQSLRCLSSVEVLALQPYFEARNLCWAYIHRLVGPADG